MTAAHYSHLSQFVLINMLDKKRVKSCAHLREELTKTWAEEGDITADAVPLTLPLLTPFRTIFVPLPLTPWPPVWD
jgi:hypothetical protein